MRDSTKKGGNIMTTWLRYNIFQINVLACKNVYLTCLNFAPPMFAKDLHYIHDKLLTRVNARDHKTTAITKVDQRCAVHVCTRVLTVNLVFWIERHAINRIRTTCKARVPPRASCAHPKRQFARHLWVRSRHRAIRAIQQTVAAISPALVKQPTRPADSRRRPNVWPAIPEVQPPCAASASDRKRPPSPTSWCPDLAR